MNHPEIIYKYRDWDNPYHRSVLIHNELFFSSPKDFNDPFDCRISENFNILDSKEKIHQYYDRSLRKNQELKYSYDIKTMMNDFEKRFEKKEMLQEEFDKLTFDAQDKYYGIYCFSTVWNNIVMWSHYAGNHKGICIGFYQNKISELKGLLIRGPVIYDKYPDIDPLHEDEIKKLLYTIHYKSKFWKYESEYRISTSFYPEVPANSDRIISFSDNCIAEIILGLNISEINEREVIKLCRNKKIPVYRAVKIPQKFEITCVPV
jgi:hypothetical protein